MTKKGPRENLDKKETVSGSVNKIIEKGRPEGDIFSDCNDYTYKTPWNERETS